MQRAIDEALREATQADDIAARAMARVQSGTTVTDPKQAANADQAADSRDQMAMLAGDAPSRGNSELAAEWWQSLSQPQRDVYERAEPVVIAGLDGVPDVERAKMDKGESGIHRAQFVDFALSHAFDSNLDDFDDNCAQFVSTSLNAAGRPQVSAFPPLNPVASPPPENPWYHYDDFDWMPGKINHSDSWAVAQDLHDHLIRTGSREVRLNEVEPGDVLFFQTNSGVIGHTAVVTGVSPDGDVKYTQHTDPAQNYSFNGRQLYEDSHSTDTTIVPVRIGNGKME